MGIKGILIVQSALSYTPTWIPHLSEQTLLLFKPNWAILLSDILTWMETESSTLVSYEPRFTALEAGILCQCFNTVWKCEDKDEESFHAHGWYCENYFCEMALSSFLTSFPGCCRGAYRKALSWSDTCCQLTQKWLWEERKTEKETERNGY